MRFAPPVLLCALLAGCGSKPAADGAPRPPAAAAAAAPEQVKAADISILFVGNSHTHSNDLADTVAAMIRHRRPGQMVLFGGVMCGFLEDVAANPLCRTELETRSWTHVVLQAQKISESGRYDYSRKEGVELAKAAKARGAAVHFYAEWGLRGKPDHGRRTEAVYRDMATQSGATVAPVGRAWELALAEKPDLPLYAPDGNHQTDVGAFLTAAVLFAAITGDDPLALAEFDYSKADPATRKLLLAAASKATRHP